MPATPYFSCELKVHRNDLHKEDDGQALLFEPSADPTNEKGPGADGQLFVRLQSWCDYHRNRHGGLKGLAGKKIRVSIEIID